MDRLGQAAQSSTASRHDLAVQRGPLVNGQQSEGCPTPEGVVNKSRRPVKTNLPHAEHCTEVRE
jgi:hypothetical protein